MSFDVRDCFVLIYVYGPIKAVSIIHEYSLPSSNPSHGVRLLVLFPKCDFPINMNHSLSSEDSKVVVGDFYIYT
jgi:hypothetical protein